MARTFALALSAALLAAPGATAATGAARDQVTDPRGDAVGGFEWADVVSARWDTKGRTVRAGGRTTYTPTHLVAALTLAAPPRREPGVTYHRRARVDECGAVWFTYEPGRVASETFGDARLWVSCESGTGDAKGMHAARLDVSGTTITWTVPLRELSRIRTGSSFRDLRAITGVADPVLGAPLVSIVEPLDYASSRATWRVGQ